MAIEKSDNFFQGNIINNCYIVSVYDSIEDEKLEKLCENTIITAHGKNLKGVIFSFINVNVIDSYTINLFIDATKVISLLGKYVVWTGLKPGVISSILDFNINTDDIQISSNIEHGIEIINKHADLI